jgi:hypothetical protein
MGAAPAAEADKMAKLVRISCQADSRLSPLSLSGLSLLPGAVYLIKYQPVASVCVIVAVALVAYLSC